MKKPKQLETKRNHLLTFLYRIAVLLHRYLSHVPFEYPIALRLRQQEPPLTHTCASTNALRFTISPAGIQQGMYQTTAA